MNLDHLLTRGRLWYGLCLLLLLSPIVQADVFRLVPKAESSLPSGKFVAVQGSAGTAGEKFVLENLSILQPVEVTLLAKDDRAELKLQLGKFDWKNPDRSGSTKGSGSATFHVRTEGDLKIQVSASQPETPYQLAVWVGDEVQPPMSPAFVSKERFKGKSLGGFDWGSPVLWIIALLLGAILAILIFIVLRGKK
ncbi:MAG: hypothetical protein BWY57_00393 [Betaproteobacteria bacterium ADurb.Bin341]|nr:MAG: hypothetical protein BWY57_00393 [Betaproteobacteria bacterium ADurb.Bin341]